MGNLKVHIVESSEKAAAKTEEIIRGEMKENRLKVLGLATGGTMIPVYKAWVQSDLSFEDVISFNLDEYVGLDAENEHSYAYFMKSHLFSHKPFKKTYIPDGQAEDLEAECANYEKLLEEHPVDVQLLGVGENGHIAFNEPGTPFNSTTHITNLTESTIEANSRFFDDPEMVPKKAVTMGIASIMNARKIILLAFGDKKRDALNKLYNGTVTEDCPVTILRQHPDVTIITDIEQ